VRRQSLAFNGIKEYSYIVYPSCCSLACFRFTCAHTPGDLVLFKTTASHQKGTLQAPLQDTLVVTLFTGALRQIPLREIARLKYRPRKRLLWHRITRMGTAPGFVFGFLPGIVNCVNYDDCIRIAPEIMFYGTAMFTVPGALLSFSGSRYCWRILENLQTTLWHVRVICKRCWLPDTVLEGNSKKYSFLFFLLPVRAKTNR